LLRHYQELSKNDCYFWHRNAAKTYICQTFTIKSVSAKVELLITEGDFILSLNS